MDRNVANVENFKNHPSVIIWSLGNENGGGPNFRRRAEGHQGHRYHAVPSITSVSASAPDNPADIDSQMYTASPRSSESPKTTTAPSRSTCANTPTRCSTRWARSASTTTCSTNTRALMGGAIWEWQDQGIWNRRDPKRQYPGLRRRIRRSAQRPLLHPQRRGLLRPLAQAALSGNETRLSVDRHRADDLAAGKVKIRNKYAFIALESIQRQLDVDRRRTDDRQRQVEDIRPGRRCRKKSSPSRLRKSIPSPAPSISCVFRLHWPRTSFGPRPAMKSPAAQFQLPVRDTGCRRRDAEKSKPVKLEKTDAQITVSGEGFSVMFDKSEGTISQLVRDKVNLLTAGGGPKLHLWRAPHRNDDMWAYKSWQDCGLENLKCSTVSI